MTNVIQFGLNSVFFQFKFLRVLSRVLLKLKFYFKITIWYSPSADISDMKESRISWQLKWDI